jgi:hypothetical protein
MFEPRTPRSKRRFGSVEELERRMPLACTTSIALGKPQNHACSQPAVATVGPLDASHLDQSEPAFAVAGSIASPPAAGLIAAPELVSPANGARLDTTRTTLRWNAVPGYTGIYRVRVTDTAWNGKQAAGFYHTCRDQYLCISTRATQLDLPVRAGATYGWSVTIRGASPSAGEFSTRVRPRPGVIPAAPPPEAVRAPELVEGRYRCSSLDEWSEKLVDASPLIQTCIDRTPDHGLVEFPAGRYFLNGQIRVTRPIELTSVGKKPGDATCSEETRDCAEWVATAGLNAFGGMLQATAMKALRFLVLDGNKDNRRASPAARACPTSNPYGFNTLIDSDHLTIEGNVVKNALCGGALVLGRGHVDVTIRNNLIKDNGIHTRRGLWSDGLTVSDLADSVLVDNRFQDNTDIDFILGGCQRCEIRGNEIRHTASRDGGSFAALMLYRWVRTSGDFSGTVISDNLIDCGPQRQCGTALYVGTEGWSDGQVRGVAAPASDRAIIRGNTFRNAMSGVYLAAQDFKLHANQYTNVHGTSIPTSCGMRTPRAPVVLSRVASANDLGGEDVVPATKSLFTRANWRRCIPNWPF